MSDINKHEHYEILNLLGYGLAKYDNAFIREFGFLTKTSFYKNFVDIGLCNTESVVKNRQDLFDPFFNNGRKGWWQKGEAYIHRKQLIDSLFGDLDVISYGQVVKMYLQENFNYKSSDIFNIKPIVSNMNDIPKITLIPNPIKALSFQQSIIKSEQIMFRSQEIEW